MFQMSSHSDSYGQRQVIAANASIRKISLGCRSMPNSPRLMPKQSHFCRPPASPAHNNGHSDGCTDSKSGGQFHSGINSPYHFSALTDHLNVQQVNNYNSQAGFPEINWQERCLELQLELHRSKNQSERIRGMLRDKVSDHLQIDTILQVFFLFLSFLLLLHSALGKWQLHFSFQHKYIFGVRYSVFLNVKWRQIHIYFKHLKINHLIFIVNTCASFITFSCCCCYGSVSFEAAIKMPCTKTYCNK